MRSVRNDLHLQIFNRKRNTARLVQFLGSIQILPPQVPTIKDRRLEGKGQESQFGIWKVNPELFRELTYQIIVSPDVLHPRSEDLERAMKLELYDRAIQNPMANQEAVFTDFLLGAYTDVKEPDDYVQKQQHGQPQGQPQQPQLGQPNPTAGQPMPPSGNSPMGGMGKMNLPQVPSTGKLG